MDQSNPENSIARGHEPPATSLRPVLWSALALVALALGTFALIDVVMQLFAAAMPVPAPQVGLRAENQLPVGVSPLNVNLTTELQRVIAQQRTVLGELEWVDKRTGIARIPIDEAMSIIAKNGLPTNFGVSPAKKDQGHAK